jgi:SAM-dependent methyltransferase
MAKKPYEGHEIEYQRMRKNNIRSWDLRDKPEVIDAGTKRFIEDALEQPWAPGNGKLIELGCGTAPLLRWLCKKGFGPGLGVDVSKTAIAMARNQSKGLKLSFKTADLCESLPAKAGSFDLAVDGHCLHCIINDEDRNAFLKNARRLLKRNGLFIVMTMCSPVDRRALDKLSNGSQKVLNHTIYSKGDWGRNYEGARTIAGQIHGATRRVPHWKTVLSEIADAGFEIRLFRVNRHHPSDPCSDLCAAATAE